MIYYSYVNRYFFYYTECFKLAKLLVICCNNASIFQTTNTNNGKITTKALSSYDEIMTKCKSRLD